MNLVVLPDGTARCVYGEAIELAALGTVNIRRASHVEPDSQGHWHADLSPVGGPILGPFDLRSDALAAEAAWLDTYWLTRANGDRLARVVSSTLIHTERKASCGVRCAS